LIRSRIHALREERGAVAVEFALISILLFMLVFGIIEFGRSYSQYEVFLNAAREGARKAAVRKSVAEINQAVSDGAVGYPLSQYPPDISRNGAPTLEDPPCNDDTVGQDLKVSWDQNFNINVPFLPDLNATVNIKGVFRCE
jgi:Flp pilus assembly protein TadG